MATRNEKGRETVGLLATAMVVIGGGLVLTFIIVAGSDDPGPILGGATVGLVVLSLLLWLLRDTKAAPGGNPVKWIFGRARKEKPDREVVVQRRTDDGDVSLAPNTPPSAEQLRDLRDYGSTWVPNKVGPSR